MIPALIAAGKFRNQVYAGITLNAATVAGGAFIRGVSGSIPFGRFFGRKIIITDTASKTATGYVGSVGAGETLGEEMLLNPGFDTDASWGKGAGWSISGGVAIQGEPANSDLYQYKSIVSGQLFLEQVDIVTLTAERFYWRNDSYPPGYQGITGVVAPAHLSRYITAINSGASTRVGFSSNASCRGSIDNRSTKRVLTPDPTGCTIVSSRGGATQTWESIESGFNPNSASFTVTISA